MKKKPFAVAFLSLALLCGCTIQEAPEKSSAIESPFETLSSGDESGESLDASNNQTPSKSDDKASSAITAESSKSEASSKPESSAKPSSPASSSLKSEVEQNDGFEITTDLAAAKEIHTSAQLSYLQYGGDYATIPTNQYPDGKSHQSDPNAVNLAWNHTALAGKTIKDYVVTFGQKSDLSDGYAVRGTSSKSISLMNVFLGTNYFKIKAEYSDGSAEESDIRTFKVAGTGPRNIKIDGMTNCRDLGGRQTVMGGKIKQGLIYRTSGVVGNNPANVTSAGLTEMKEHLKMKTEINVADSTSYNGTGKGWNVVNCLMDYNNKNISQNQDTWHHFSRNAESVKAVFKLLGDINNYPVFYHCRIGTDRTGLTAILINGLLGMDKNLILQDYLFSNFGNIGEKRYIGTQAGQDNIENYLNEIEAMPGATWYQKTYNTLLAIGVPATVLNTVIGILTEGTQVSGNDAGQMIGMGTSLVTTGSAMKTSSTRDNPEKYYELSNGQSVSYTFNLPKNYNAYATAYLGIADASKTNKLAGAIKVEIDGVEATVADKSYYQAGFGNLGRTCYYFNCIGEKALSTGSHTIKLTAKTSLKIGALSLFDKNQTGNSSTGGNQPATSEPSSQTSSSETPIVPETHTNHAWVNGAKNDDLQAQSCLCGKNAYLLLVSDATGYNNSSASKMKNVNSLWDVQGIAQGTYEIYVEAKCSGGNMDKAGFSDNNDGPNLYRYYFMLNEDQASKIVADTGTKKYYEIGINESAFNFTSEKVATMTVSAGVTQFSMNHTGAGYSVYVNSIRLVKIA